jgi:hypothetical protein
VLKGKAVDVKKGAVAAQDRRRQRPELDDHGRPVADLGINEGDQDEQRP